MRDLSKVVAELGRQREERKADLNRIEQAIAALGGHVRRGRTAKRGRGRSASKRRSRRRLTVAQRKAISIRMKRSWVARKAGAKK